MIAALPEQTTHFSIRSAGYEYRFITALSSRN